MTDIAPFTLDSTLSLNSFWGVDFLSKESAWLEHAPFAFWLVSSEVPKSFVELGTHAGFSFFSVCQAVKRQNLTTSCYAIDTWQGDEHAGMYGEEVFASVNNYNESHFKSFSHLIRSTFDDALSQFEDGSVDLLHIDGRHFYADVKSDFEKWLPKVSDRGVILFHDTNVLDRDFGVHQLWAELRDNFPSFEFLHGHGLGVLGVGTKLSATLIEWFAASKSPDATNMIRSTYERLGLAVKLSSIVQEQKNELSRLHSDLAIRETSIAALEDQIAKLNYSKETQAAVVSQLSVELGEKSSLLTESSTTIKSLNETVAILTASQSSLETQIASIHKSRAWRVLHGLDKLLHPMRSETNA